MLKDFIVRNLIWILSVIQSLVYVFLGIEILYPDFTFIILSGIVVTLSLVELITIFSSKLLPRKLNDLLVNSKWYYQNLKDSDLPYIWIGYSFLIFSRFLFKPMIDVLASFLGMVFSLIF